MQSCNTVYGIACCNCQMCHFNLTIIDNCHFTHFFLIAGIFCLDFLHETAVDLLYNLVNTGKQTAEQLNRPFLQSFRHNGMVGIGAGLGCYLPCFFPCQIIFVKQNSHQFSYCNSRMGII